MRKNFCVLTFGLIVAACGGGETEQAPAEKTNTVPIAISVSAIASIARDSLLSILGLKFDI